MKKILSFLLVLITLAFCTVPIYAAERNIGDIVKDEVSQLVDISDYKANNTIGEIFLISVVETDFTSNGFSDSSELYLYFYNPSKKKINSSVLNSVSIATSYDLDGNPISFKKYNLNLNLDGAKSTNDLFIRASVVAKAKDIAVVRSGKRYYGITEFELYEDSQYNAQAYNVSYIYKFSGYGSNLKCVREDFLTLELNVHQTSYLTGSSTIENTSGVMYSNQINSVYFSIPKNIENKYGKLYSVSYEYYKAYTSPYFITDSEILNNRIVDWVEDGTSLSDLYFCRKFELSKSANCSYQYDSDLIYMVDAVGSGRDYSDFPHSYNGFHQFSNTHQILPYGTYIKPTVSFKVGCVEEDKILATSNDVQEAFIEYTLNYSQNGESLYRGKYSYDLIALDNEDKLPSFVSETKTRDDLFSIEEASVHWWDRIFGFAVHGTVDDEVKYIEQITLTDLLSNNFSDEFLVSSLDVSRLKAFFTTESLKGNNTYILRYAQTDDYKCSSMWYEIPSNTSSGYENSKCVAVQHSFYSDFDIIKLTFGSGEKAITTFGVVSTPTDGFVDIEIFNPDTLKDLLSSDDDFSMSKLFKIVVGVVLIVIGCYLVINIITFASSGFTVFVNSIENKKTRKVMNKTMNSNDQNTNLGTLSWKDKLRFANERRRKNISDYRQRRKEKLEYKASVQKNKLAKYEAKQKARQIRYEADSYRDENRYSRAERKNMTRESRARVRSMNRASKRRRSHGNNYRSRRSRSYNRNRYRY